MAKTKGKLVDTWIYSYKGIEQGEDGEAIPAGDPIVRDRKVEVAVRMMKETRELDRPPHETVSVAIEATSADPRFTIEGTDIEALRRAVWARLDRHYAIDWQPYFLVTVERPSHYHGAGTGVMVSWTTVHKGIAWDGTELLREFAWHRSPTDELYKVSPWPGAFRDKGGRVIACIEATKRNEAALLEFAEKLDALRKLLAGFLSPDRIEQTLANLAGVAFLPPASGKSERSDDEARADEANADGASA